MSFVVAGATSETGVAVIRRLIRHIDPREVTCVVRPTARTQALARLGVRLLTGDVADLGAVGPVLGPAIRYLDMTHPRYYPWSVPALVRAGVKRAFFVTTTGIFSRYHRCAAIYRDGEERIRNSGIAFTILRPSMIYGTPGDKNMHRLIRFLARTPVFPLFNGGRSLMQPVHVEDLADGVVAAITTPGTESQAYNLAGPTGISYREIVEIIRRLLGCRVTIVPVPNNLAYVVVRGLQWLPGFPITDEQVLRLQEEKVFDITSAVHDLRYAPRPFEDGIRGEIEAMRACGVLHPARSPLVGVPTSR